MPNYMPMPEGAVCSGSGPAHCCWVNGELCPYLVVDQHPTRKFACGLRWELGSWEAVYADPRYQRDIRAAFDSWAPDWPDCGDWWPSRGVCCGETN